MIKGEETKMSTIVDVKGTPYEQGVQEGEQLRDVIARNIGTVERSLVDNHMDSERYRTFVARNLEFMRRAHQDIYDEMRGIADGAQIPFDKIVRLNIPAYFMDEYFSQECSMLMVRGKATADGNTYVIKNRDMSMYIEQAVIRREYPDGLKMVEINGAGTVTYPACGMNSYGLGVTNTGFWSSKAPSDVERVDSAHIFLNSHILLYHCKSAKEALEQVKNTPRMNGLNVILVDTRDAYCVEMTKDDVFVQEDDGSGVFYRSNHYISEKFSHLNPSPEEYMSTFARYERIGELVQERYGKLRFQDLFRIMSDHKNGVNAICRHPQGSVLSQTISCSMFVLEDREAWTTIGNPCEHLKFTAI